MGIDRGAKLAAIKEKVPPQYKPENSEKLPAVAKDHAAALAPVPVAAKPAPKSAAAMAVDVTRDSSESEPLETQTAAPKSQFNVEPATVKEDPGEDSFVTAAEEQHEKLAEKKLTIDNLALSAQEKGEAGPTVNGHLASGSRGSAAMERMLSENAEKKKREDDSFMRHILLLQKLDKKIAFWQGEYERYDKQVSALDEAIAKLERGEKIELDEDGYPKDPALREAIREYEERHGTKIDPNDPKAMKAVRSESERKRAFAGRKRDENKDLRRELEENPNDPATIKKIEEHLQTDSGVKKVASAAALSEDRSVKEIVHDTAAKTSTDSKLAEQSLSEAGFFAQSNDPFGQDPFAAADTNRATTSHAKAEDPGTGSKETSKLAFNAVADPQPQITQAEQTPTAPAIAPDTFTNTA